LYLGLCVKLTPSSEKSILLTLRGVVGTDYLSDKKELCQLHGGSGVLWGGLRCNCCVILCLV